MVKSTKLVITRASGHDQARKVDLGNKIGIARHAFAGCTQGRGKKLPWQHACHHEQGIGCGTIGVKFCDAAEEDREYDHCQKRANDCPGNADGGLLISDQDIPPREEVEKFTVTPKIAPVIFFRASRFNNPVRSSSCLISADLLMLPLILRSTR